MNHSRSHSDMTNSIEAEAVEKKRLTLSIINMYV